MKYHISARFFGLKQRFGVMLLGTVWMVFYLWYLALIYGLFFNAEVQPVDRYFVDERLVNFLHNKTQLTKKRLQIIVLWTEWFGDPEWSEFWTVGDQLLEISNDENGNERRCYLTTSRRYLPKASAIVFHGRDFRFSETPHIRFDWQRWVFYLLESPINSFFEIRHWLAADFIGFNWTMGYRRTADVYAPYVYTEERNAWDYRKNAAKISTRIKTLAKKFVAKKKMAVWLTSNCETSARREQLVQALIVLGIEVDVFGACSTSQLKPPVNDTQFIAAYRFYFAFENSYCEDYVTEKAARGLQLSQLYGVIPVVYGGANYAAILPKGSYIDALAFDSANVLAALLAALAETRDVSVIEPYFTWQYWAFVGDESAWLKTHLIRGMESLCRKLWLSDLRHCAHEHESNDNMTIDMDSTCNEDDEETHSTVTNLRLALGQCRY